MLYNANPNPDPNSGDEEDALDEAFMERALNLDESYMNPTPAEPPSRIIDLDYTVDDEEGEEGEE
jgi:hypothetical protein